MTIRRRVFSIKYFLISKKHDYSLSRKHEYTNFSPENTSIQTSLGYPSKQTSLGYTNLSLLLRSKSLKIERNTLKKENNENSQGLLNNVEELNNGFSQPKTLYALNCRFIIDTLIFSKFSISLMYCMVYFSCCFLFFST